MKDYRINVKVRNNRLLSAIEESGYISGVVFSEKVGISYTILMQFINLRRSPIGKDGMLDPAAEKLCVFLARGHNELWSDELIEPLAVNKSEIFADREQIQTMLIERSDPVLKLENKETMQILYNFLDRLPQREADILRKRFGWEGGEWYDRKTHREIGKEQGVSIERARQLEATALRKLRGWIWKDPAALEALKSVL